MTVYKAGGKNGPEYCYCHRCRRIREASDLLVTTEGLQCGHCGETGLDEPGWVACPNFKMTQVKCPRAGRGLYDNGQGLFCADRCFFRAGPG